MTNGKLVLLVEDNEDDIELTLHSFKSHRIANDIRVARDGVEALDFLLKRGPHAGEDPRLQPMLVLLDLKLPKVDGLAVLRELRTHHTTRRIPVVVLTSSKEPQDLEQCYDLGVNSYIRKPVDFDQFAESVKSLGLYWLVLNEQPPEVKTSP